MKKTSNYVISCLVAVAILFSITTTAFAANYNTNYSLNGDGAHDIVEVAKAQKGIGGKSGGSAFGFPAKQSWCAYFVCWAGRTAGADFPKSDLGTPDAVAKWFIDNNKGTFYCLRDGNYKNLISKGVKNKDNIIRTTREQFTPQKGDLICYLWSYEVGRYNWSHIGIVIDSKGNSISTVEGNTGGGRYDGTVKIQDRSYNSEVIGFIRPNYNKSSTGSDTSNKPQYFECNIQITCSPGKEVNLYNNPGDSNRAEYFSKGQSVVSTRGAKLSNGTTWYKITVEKRDTKEIRDFWLKYDGSRMTLKDLSNREPNPDNVTLTLSKSSFELKPGEQATLNFSFTGNIGYPEIQPDGSGALTDISGSWNADKRSGWATFTAVTAGTGSISINLFDKNGNLLISKTASIIVKEPDTPEKDRNVKLTLENPIIKVSPGETATFNFTFTGDAGRVDYKILDKSICKYVSEEWNQSEHKGHITFSTLAEGTTNIPIFLYDKNENLADFYLATLTVKKATTSNSSQKETTLTFDPSSISLDLTKQKSQKVTLTLGGDFSWGDKLYRSVSNPDVASVDWSSYESGAVFCPVITAKAVGETILTCSVVDKDTGITRATAQLKITVTPANYTVRYDANGGTNAPASQSKIAKQDLTLTSDCPKREGFTFAGWATSRNGSVQYRPGDSFTTDQDVTLYAIWEAENQVSLTLANDSFTVKPGEQATLRFTFTGDIGYPEAQLDESGVLKDAIGSWNADKCSGSVTFTAVRAGTGSVTINLRDKNDDLLISKTASIIVKEVAISEPSIQVAATQMNLVAGTGNARSNYAITNPQGWPVKWYSSDTSIVTVDANGSSTTVTPVRAGTATITASMSFDGITYESSCTVTVTQANVELSETSLEMVAGEAVSLYVLGNQNVTWSSTNPSVATVDRNGVVTALQSGYATIKAQLKDDPSMRALCYVTVTESDTDEGSISLSWYRNELSIDIGRVSGASLHANIYPAGQTITWMSSDPNVATVESYDDDSANVCAKSVGTAIITASFTYKGKTYSANSIVTVTSSFAPGPDDDRVFFGVGG